MPLRTRSLTQPGWMLSLRSPGTHTFDTPIFPAGPQDDGQPFVILLLNGIAPDTSGRIEIVINNGNLVIDRGLGAPTIVSASYELCFPNC